MHSRGVLVLHNCGSTRLRVDRRCPKSKGAYEIGERGWRWVAVKTGREGIRSQLACGGDQSVSDKRGYEGWGSKMNMSNAWLMGAPIRLIRSRASPIVDPKRSLQSRSKVCCSSNSIMM